MGRKVYHRKRVLASSCDWFAVLEKAREAGKGKRWAGTTEQKACGRTPQAEGGKSDSA